MTKAPEFCAPLHISVLRSLVRGFGTPISGATISLTSRESIVLSAVNLRSNSVGRSTVAGYVISCCAVSATLLWERFIFSKAGPLENKGAPLKL